MAVDLTQTDPTPTTPLVAFQIAPYSPARAREWVRGTIAILLVSALIALLVAATWIFAEHLDQTDQLQKYLSAVLTPLIGLVGTVLGFYFGEKAAASDR